MTEAYTLTHQQLIEVCVQFSTIMGWIDDLYGAEWYRRIKGYSSPAGFHMSMSSAMREAVERAADGDNTSVEALSRFKAAWEG